MMVVKRTKKIIINVSLSDRGWSVCHTFIGARFSFQALLSFSFFSQTRPVFQTPFLFLLQAAVLVVHQTSLDSQKDAGRGGRVAVVGDIGW